MSGPESAPEKSFDASDPYRREEQTFPKLTDAQIDRVRPLAEVADLEPGALLFERGDRRVPFFVVLKGAIEILDHSSGEPEVITVHAHHQFTGELDLFNDRKILVSGRAQGPTRVLRLERPRFQRLMTAEPSLAELIMRALILRRVGLIQHEQGGVVLVGDPHDGATLDLARFLRRNGYPLRVVAPEDAGDLNLPADCPFPSVRLPSGDLICKPTRRELAVQLGLCEGVREGHVHDVAVVGAGPAGLAAAVYAASEGLDTVVIESLAPGGQAATSSRIENYLGFPTGISGQALAGRAQIQAQKFGARLLISRAVTKLRHEGEDYVCVLEGGTEVRTRSVVVATGASYRRLGLDRFEEFERHGIHFAATAMEAELCHNEEVVVVGGGNSAGQAAVFLSQHANRVHMLIRSDTLAESMSDYLIGRLEAAPNIDLRYRTQLTELCGSAYLESVRWRGPDGEVEERPVSNVFVMIGAQPNTAWLGDCVELDENAFVKTGSHGMMFGTSAPGVVAVGDVQSGSVKRVASAVGQGSVVIQSLHRYLQERGRPDA
ncbi:MAG: FAD-dependent oxidoreductase [Myxococcota bacterium]